MEQNQPLFSIITPTFNCAQKLDSTIQSIFSQDESLWDYWVIDGGSTDGTVNHLLQNESKLQWLSEPDKGIYDAMNKGVQRARGKFVYVLGAGDRLRPNILSTIAQELTKNRDISHPRPLLLYGDVIWGETGRRYDGHFSKLKLADTNICQQAIFYDSRIFTKLGNFDTQYSLCADYHFNFRCFADPSIRRRYIDIVVANYESPGASKAIDQRFYADRPELIRRHFGDHYSVAVTVIRKLQALKQNIGGLKRKLLSG
ncbi:MAG TPA: glycosyltransferase family 2 protein [Chryseolinea sp.]